MATSIAQAWTRLRQEAAAGGLPPRSPALPPSTNRIPATRPPAASRSAKLAHPSSGGISASSSPVVVRVVDFPDDAA